MGIRGEVRVGGLNCVWKAYRGHVRVAEVAWRSDSFGRVLSRERILY